MSRFVKDVRGLITTTGIPPSVILPTYGRGALGRACVVNLLTFIQIIVENKLGQSSYARMVIGTGWLK